MGEVYTFERVLAEQGRLVMTNKGVSMLPLLRQDRDLMVIEPKIETRCQKYDAVLFKRDNGQYVLHRVIEVRPTDYLVIGDNSFQREYVKERQILGILTAVVRDTRTISCTDRGYLAFVHLWWAIFPLRELLARGRGLAGAAVRKLRRRIRSST